MCSALLYFLINAYLNILAQSQILVISLYVISFEVYDVS